jgi:gliding motility-associated-like protein
MKEHQSATQKMNIGMGMKKNTILRLAWQMALVMIALHVPSIGYSQGMFTQVIPASPFRGYRTGAVITLRGTNFNNTCSTDVVNVKWTTPLPAGQVTLTRSSMPPLFSTSTFYTIAGTGTHDLVFQLPPGLPCGPKTIEYVYRPSNCTAAPLTMTFVLPRNTLDSASVIYPIDTFCVGDNGTIPVLLDPVSVTTPMETALSLVSFSGQFYSHTGVLGHHPMTAIANQDPVQMPAIPFCTDTSIFDIWILGPGSPQSMVYRDSIGPYCPSDPLDVFVPLATYPGSVSGVFSSSPAGLSLNSSFGAIRADSSLTGTYQVKYKPPYQECASDVFAFVTIESVQETRFQYTSSICARDSGLAPSVTSFVAGTFSPIATGLPGSAGTLRVDPITGVLDATFATRGRFRVIFTPTSGPPGVCSDTSSAIVRVVGLPRVQFTFPGNQDSACQGASPVLLNLGTSVNSGTFFERTGSIDFVSPTPPASIDLGASAPGGPYQITYVADSIGLNVVCTDSFSRPFTVVSNATAVVSYPVVTFCKGASDTIFPVFTSGAVGGTFSGPSTPGAPILDPSTGRLVITPNTIAGTFGITYNYPTSAICTASSSTLVDSVRVIAVPVVDVRFAAAVNDDTLTVCSNQTSVTLQRIVTNPPPGVNEILQIYGGPTTSPITIAANNLVTVSSVGVGGPYPIIFGVELSPSGCKTYDTIYLKVNPFFSSAFNYVDSVACQGGSNPVPNILVQGGGVFYQISNLNISFDPQTGEVDISNISQVVGTDLIMGYTTSNLDAICSDSSQDRIQLIGNNSADFEYGGVRFCQSDNDTLFPTYLGLAIDSGLFVATPMIPGDSLAIDPKFGIVNVALSDTGTYTISNSISGGGCVAQFSLSITILPGFLPTTMNYVDTAFCAGQPNPTPILVGDLSGVFIGTPGINLIDTLGTIDLSNSLPRPGQPYVITYRLENDFGCSVSIEDSILILQLGGSKFLFVPNFICSTDTFFELDTIPTVPGNFTLQSEFGQFLPNAIDTTTGQITVDSLGNNFQTQFTAYFTPDADQCAEPSFQILNYLRGPDSASITPFPDTLFCANQTVRVEARGILDGAFFTYNGRKVPAYDWVQSFVQSGAWEDGGVVDVVLFTGEHVVTVVDTVGADSATLDTSKMCFIRRSVTFNVTPLPVLTLDANTVDVVSSDQEIVFNFTSDTDNTVVNWFADNLNTLAPNAIFSPSGGQVTSGLANFPFPITNQVNLIFPNSPAQAVYTFIPSALNCIGTIVKDTVNINPESADVFVPAVFTPDGDEFNPTWLVQVKNGVNPADYTLVLYNRAGGVVLQMTPLTDTWDGGDLPDGVYWWNLLRGNQSVNKGGLTIRRK